MPYIPSGTQFGGSGYNNPQMSVNNLYGGGQGQSQPSSGGFNPQGYNPYSSGSPQPNTTGNAAQDAYNYQRWLQAGGGQSANPALPGNWYNQNSPMSQWQQGFAPPQAAWQGDAPGHQGQEYSYNPLTGEGGWVNASGGTSINGYNPYGGDALTWTDPKTGMKSINTSALSGLMGGLGFGGSSKDWEPQTYSLTDMPETGKVTPGAGWGGFDYDTIGSGIDPGAVIAAQEYKLQEAMEGDMAQAGARAGKSGFAMSTPYMDSLGAAARKASQDRNAITMQYQYDAAQQQAARDTQQQLDAANKAFGGWQTGYMGDLDAQKFNAGNAMQQWLMQNEMGMKNVDLQNQASMYNQGNEQALMNQILGMIGGLF
jgi:hypothetical protein